MTCLKIAALIFLLGIASLLSLSAAVPSETLVEARSLLEAGRPQDARQILVSQRQELQGSAEYWLLWAATSALLEDWSEAETGYRRCLEFKPGEPTLLAGLGLSLSNQQKWTESARILEQSIEAGGTGVTLWFLLSRAQLQSNRVTESLGSFQQAISLQPDSEELYLDFGELLVTGKAYHQAEILYRQGLRQIPDSPRLTYALAVTLQLQLKWRQAQQYFLNLVEKDPEFPRVHLSLARSYVETGDVGRAELAYRVALKKDPEDWESHFYFGLLLAQTGRLQQAVEHFQESVNLTDEVYRPHLELGRVLLKLERYQEAELSLKEAAQINGEMKEPYFELGNLYRKTGNLEKAAAAFEQYRQLLEKQERERTPGRILVP